MTTVDHSTEPTTDSAEDAVIVDWLERHFGGTVVMLTRQERWRPAWFADVEVDGTVLPLCVRGDRVDAITPFPLEHERILFEQLDRAGIPVPHVHGWIAELPAIVMDRVPGQSDFAGSTPEQKQTAIDEYAAVLARIHRLDVGPFADAGIARADTPADAGRLGIAGYLNAYRARKSSPQPVVEFVVGWCERNRPPTADRESVVVWDSLQFHHVDGRLTAVLDLEAGHIGDPMMDLAGMRSRNPYLNYGDIHAIYRTYEECGGFPVDLDAIDYYFIEESILNALAFGHSLVNPVEGTDLVINKTWIHLTNLWALEVMADRLGVTVARPELSGNTPAPGFIAAPLAHMAATMRRRVATSTSFDQYQSRADLRLATHLRRLGEIGAEVTAADIADVAALLGTAPTSWDDANSALEAFILTDDGAHDAELIALLFRREWRHWLTIAAPGSALAKWEPIQLLRRE